MLRTFRRPIRSRGSILKDPDALHDVKCEERYEAERLEAEREAQNDAGGAA